MRSNQTFGIDFIARACKEAPTMAFIYAKITVDQGRPAELSLKEKIKLTDWDWQAEKVKGRTESVKSINTYIDDVRAKIKAKYKELQVADEILTAQAVKAAYLGIQQQLKGHTLVELLNYFKKINKDKLKPGNFKNYDTTVDYVILFLENNFAEKNVYLSQINMQFATDLENYIRNHPIKENDPCQGNGLAKHLQRFKRIMNWAADDIEWLKPSPIAKYKCGVKKARKKKLVLEEVFHIETLPHLTPELEYIHDLFIFSCYTGLAFADVMALTLMDLEEAEDGIMWLKLYRQKSNELCTVPLLKKAGLLIKKYLHKGNAFEGGRIFPQITNQYVNRQLKVIQLIAGIPLKLTFHLARHTFAKTIALKHKIPIEVVQMMLGHSKITTTMEYADVDEEKILDDTQGWEDKLDAKRALFISLKERENGSKATLKWDASVNATRV